VLERYDEDTLYLARGAPRRWFAPFTSTSSGAIHTAGAGDSGGFGIDGASTRFGRVSLQVGPNDVRPDGKGQTASAAVAFTSAAAAVPGITSTPVFALRLRSSDPQDMLDPATVAVTGAGASVQRVDVASSTIYVTIKPGTDTFSVVASFTHA
jgi:hypothetical protein